MRRIWDTATFGSVHPGRRMLALATLGALAGLGETLAVLLIIALVSGDAFASSPLSGQLPSETAALALAALGTVAVLAVVHLGTARLTARATAEAGANIQRRLARAFLRAPWQAQVRSPPGELQDLATVKAITLAVGVQQGATAASALVNMLVVLVAAVAIGPLAALALLATVAVVLALTRPVRRRRLAIVERYRASSLDLAVEVTESAALARDVRVFGVGDRAFARLDGGITAAERQMRDLQQITMATGTLTRDATLAMLVGGLALVVSGGDVALPALASTVVLMLRVLAHAQQLTGFITRFEELSLNVLALKTTLTAWEEDVPRGTAPCPAVDRLVLQDVSVTYPERTEPAVRDASLELARGEMLGVVGRTGAGKSTLASVLLGLLEPSSGRVLVDGRPLGELDPGDWHARTAWVGQEPRLLAGTVADNIRFLRPELSDAALVRAAERAGLGRELAAWPDGLDHAVGPAGAALSGGERQRVVLARALAGDPDLLVLDEPTSALDAHTEEAVRTAIAEARAERIVVVIAHRLSTLHACDRIAVVVDGRVEAVAAPAALEAGNQYYREALAASRP